MTTRKFDIGRQNEVLMNQTHYDIFKALEFYFNHPSDFSKGPETFDASNDEIINGALWLDKYSNNDSADIKYYDSGVWKLLFGDRFKLICDILSPKEPESPVEGQLWINTSGTLMYYKSGQFIPVKANLSDVEDFNPLQYEDFLIVSPLAGAECSVLNNFGKFLFAHTPIEDWKKGVHYYYQQGVTYNNTLYVCNREHISSDTESIESPYYWSRVDSLVQFLVPNTTYDKLFVNGKFLHEKEGAKPYGLYDTYKQMAITFDYEDSTVLHDSLRYDIDGDLGLYDYAIGVTTDSSTTPAPPAGTTDVTIKDDEGYLKNTNVSLYIPEDYILRDKDINGDYIDNEYVYGNDSSYKLISAVHVNPTKIDKITKYFFKLNKTTNIVPIPKEGTEYYGVKDGIGMLLIETTDDQTHDYCSALYNNKICIKVSDATALKYDYIYAIHYDFVLDAKKAGILYRQKVHLNDYASVYIGYENPKRIAVFANGLFYQQDTNTYDYDYNTKYIMFKDKLLVSNTQRMNVEILRFPKMYKGKITPGNYINSHYISGKGYRVDLNAIPFNTSHCLGFISGIQTNPQDGFVFYPDDPTAVYFPNLTKDYVTTEGQVSWTIAETDMVQGGTVIHQMYRGRTKAKIIGSEIGISITRDMNLATSDIPYLDYIESPIAFVDGTLIAQKDINVYEDHISIDGLTEGQDVILLADTNSNITIDDIIDKTEILVNVKNYDPSLALVEDPDKLKLVEDITDINTGVDILTSFIYEDKRYLHEIYNFSKVTEQNSDSVIYDDSISNVMIRTERNDSTIMYLKNGLICDTESVIVTELPEEAYDGEIKHLYNTVQDAWYKYNAYKLQWEAIDATEIPVVAGDVNGYTSYSNNVSILTPLNGQRYCTSFSYVYSDTVEKELMTGFIDCDGQSGINEESSEFRLNIKHHYVPGRNELTVYLNGIRQTLLSPFDANFNNSTTRECSLTGTNTFALAYNDGTVTGKAIDSADGFYTYETITNGYRDYMYKNVQLTDAEIQAIKDSSVDIKLVSSPNKNRIFYVVEPCETGEAIACTRNTLTYKDAISTNGAFANDMYSSDSLNLNKGNIRVFVNGLRQPYGSYKDINGNTLEAYKIIDTHTIQFQSPLIGGHGGNLGDNTTPLFPIRPADPSRDFNVLDEIVVETRTDYTLREITLPLAYGKNTFTMKDGLPEDIFKTKDTIMIYINGYAYGNTYKNEYKTISLLDTNIEKIIDTSGKNYITFEWR
jgi:hypothetical protein